MKKHAPTPQLRVTQHAIIDSVVVSTGQNTLYLEFPDGWHDDGIPLPPEQAQQWAQRVGQKVTIHITTPT